MHPSLTKSVAINNYTRRSTHSCEVSPDPLILNIMSSSRTTSAQQQNSTTNRSSKGRRAIQLHPPSVLTVAFTVGGGGKVAGVAGGTGEFEVAGTVDVAWLGDACNGRARGKRTATEPEHDTNSLRYSAHANKNHTEEASVIIISRSAATTSCHDGAPETNRW